ALLAGDPVGEAVWLGAFDNCPVKCGPVHRAVEVAQPFSALADQFADLSPALQPQLEALKLLGTVDRVEHAGPAQFLVASLGRHEPIDGDQMRQVRLAGVRHLLDPQPDQEVRQFLVASVHDHPSTKRARSRRAAATRRDSFSYASSMVGGSPASGAK